LNVAGLLVDVELIAELPRPAVEETAVVVVLEKGRV
jgi:hypothetical protein